MKIISRNYRDVHLDAYHSILLFTAVSPKDYCISFWGGSKRIDKDYFLSDDAQKLINKILLSVVANAYAHKIKRIAVLIMAPIGIGMHSYEIEQKIKKAVHSFDDIEDYNDLELHIIRGFSYSPFTTDNCDGYIETNKYILSMVPNNAFEYLQKLRDEYRGSIPFEQSDEYKRFLRHEDLNERAIFDTILQKQIEKHKEDIANSYITESNDAEMSLDDYIEAHLQADVRAAIYDKVIIYENSKGVNDSFVAERAGMNRSTFSSLLNGGRTFAKDKIVAVGIALELSFEEIEGLLHNAGLMFSGSSKRDLIIECVLKRQDKEKIDLNKINDILYSYDEKLLGEQTR